MPDFKVIVAGCAKGADKLGEQYAEIRQFRIIKTGEVDIS